MELLLNTVSLSKIENKSWLFRCFRCGTSITRVEGELVGISAGWEPTSDVLVISQCHNCHENYTFQTRQTKNLIAKLTLSLYLDQSAFLCVICRSRLLEYNAELIQQMPERNLLDLPASFTCFKYDCHKQYQLNEIVTLN